MVTKLNNRLNYILFILFILLLASCKQEVLTEDETRETYYNCSVYTGSNPSGIKIYIDGKNSGLVTPDTIKRLNEGQHKITLKFDLFADTSITFQAQPSLTSVVYVDYYASSRNYGAIKCESVPTNASIFLNNNKLEQSTPYTIPLLFPGNYKVRFHYPECRDDSSNVTVWGGNTTYLKLSLQDTSVWIDYRLNDSSIPSNRIIGIKNDNKGNMWAATLDDGFIKFDGKKFTLYNSTNSPLPFDFVTCIEVDKSNNVWIGTMGGLARFDGANWTIYDKKSSKLPSDLISALYCDPDGNIWIGTEKGLVRITGNEMFAYNSQISPLLSSYTNCIMTDPQGNLWVASGAGVSKLEAGVWKTYIDEFGSSVGSDARRMAVDSEGNIWCSFAENPPAGIMGGIMKFNGTVWTKVALSGIPNGRIQQVYFDSKGYKWFGSDNGFLVIKPNDTRTIYRSANYAMWSYDVRDIMVDKNNIAWIALMGGGLLKWKMPYN